MSLFQEGIKKRFRIVPSNKGSSNKENKTTIYDSTARLSVGGTIQKCYSPKISLGRSSLHLFKPSTLRLEPFQLPIYDNSSEQLSQLHQSVCKASELVYSNRESICELRKQMRIISIKLGAALNETENLLLVQITQLNDTLSSVKHEHNVNNFTARNSTSTLGSAMSCLVQHIETTGSHLAQIEDELAIQ